MNVVSARRPQYGFGQAMIDPSSIFIMPDGTASDGSTPDFTDPNITYGAGSGAPPISYQPSVPQPPSSSLPGFTFPAGTVQQLFPQGLPPGPSPRVNLPVSAPGGLSMWFKNNLPLVLGLGAAVLILPDLVGGGKRRR